ncbi:MAG: hypothetical protein CMI30_06155 [Opitutae bacterium]|jgi:hypothetical protein|nr:hypothetical protein [Opitutae bacterium]|tara:strand:+ start:1365 stop:1703 length:339 start_codon:yes stop_codon:yes gene_type:complete
MKTYTKILFSLALGIGAWLVVQAQQAPSPPTSLPTPPAPPKNLPKFPSFGAGGDNGKYQFVTAEYYSLDAQKKWFLYKQLVKADTTTGEAWVLQSSRDNAGEFTNKWVPLIK